MSEKVFERTLGIENILCFHPEYFQYSVIKRIRALQKGEPVVMTCIYRRPLVPPVFASFLCQRHKSLSSRVSVGTQQPFQTFVNLESASIGNQNYQPSEGKSSIEEGSTRRPQILKKWLQLFGSVLTQQIITTYSNSLLILQPVLNQALLHKQTIWQSTEYLETLTQLSVCLKL